MSKVDVLRDICDPVSAVIKQEIGRTGYLDQPVRPIDSVMKGVDSAGRLFLTVCVQSALFSAQPELHHEEPDAGIITLFQRYSAPSPGETETPDTIAQANNFGSPKFLRGAATHFDLVQLAKLITFGRIRFPYETYEDENAVLELTLLTVEEIELMMKKDES